jgi:hypothetical protein
LIRRIYERRSADEQRKRDVILGREPFKIVDQDHTHPASLEPRPQSRAIRAFCRNMTLDRDGTQRLSSAFALHVPFVHWETEENRAEMNHVMETVRRGRKNDLDNLDSPSQSQKSIPDLKAIQEHLDWCKNEKMLCAYLYNQPPVHPRRTLDQFYYHMLEDTKERDQDQVITRYYHNVWKRNLKAPVDEDEFNFAMPPADEPEFPFRLDNVVDDGPAFEHGDTLVKDHDTEGLPPAKIAESGLSRLDSNTSSTEAKEPRFVMMVDQLWLWILDESKYLFLVSTSLLIKFANRYHYNKLSPECKDNPPSVSCAPFYDRLHSLQPRLPVLQTPPLSKKLPDEENTDISFLSGVVMTKALSARGTQEMS